MNQEILKKVELWKAHVTKEELKAIEEMVELYYNSGKFLQTIDYLVPFYPSPFAFFEQLSQYWLAENCHYQSQSKLGLCTILYNFAAQNNKTTIQV